MARILGVDLPRNKAMRIAIRSIYGVGPKIGTDVLNAAGIDLEKNSNDLTEEEVKRSDKFLIIIQLKVILRREVGLNIKRLKDLGCYRGIRHRRGLPVRGQRTSY
jgi:small subunit ribosomal protein S13